MSGFPETVDEGPMTARIYAADGEFTVADQAGWLPGVFPSRDAALAAAREAQRGG